MLDIMSISLHRFVWIGESEHIFAPPARSYAFRLLLISATAATDIFSSTLLRNAKIGGAFKFENAAAPILPFGSNHRLFHTPPTWSEIKPDTPRPQGPQAKSTVAQEKKVCSICNGLARWRPIVLLPLTLILVCVLVRVFKDQPANVNVYPI